MGTIGDELTGAEVASVEFVRDYLQLHLEADSDVPAIGGGWQVRNIHVSAITDPEVESGGQRQRKGDPGWRDALCALINARVRHATIDDGEEFRVEFDTGAVFRVSLRTADYHGPEAVNVFGLGTWIL